MRLPCPNARHRLDRKKSTSFIDALGLNSFSLFRNRKMAMFFIFAMLLGAALQLTNAYGDTFLHDFANIDKYKGSDCGKISCDHYVYFSDFRNVIHSCHSIFSEKIWYQTSNVYQYDGLGASFWLICLWQSGRWLMDDHTFMYCLWNGV